MENVKLPNNINPFTLSSPISDSMSENSYASSPALKRPPERESGESPDTKKPSTEEGVNENVGEAIMEKFFQKVQSAIDLASKKTEEKIESYIQSMENLKIGQTSLLERVEKLENLPSPPSIQEAKEQIKDSLVPEIVEEMSKSFDGQWKHYLISQIGQVESHIVINGLEKSKADATNFFADFCEKDLKMSQEDFRTLLVKDIRISKIRDNPKCTVFVSLGSVFQRNTCLKYTRNLSGSVSMDKQIPKIYMAAYKDFKEIAWKLRSVHNVSTRIDFEGPKLILRQRKHKGLGQNDVGFAFSIYKEFIPPVEQPITKAVYSPKVGETASPPIPEFDGIISFMSNIQGAKDIEEILDVYSSQVKENILRAEIVGGKTAVFYFESRVSYDNFIKATVDVKFKDKKIKLTAF